jgi:hypothetical protein
MHPLAPIPSLTSPTPGACVAKVRAPVNADPLSGYPSNVNYAVAWSYTVDVQTPNGMIGPFEGAIPSVPRAPYPWLVTAFPIGTLLPAVMVNGIIYLMLAEDRWAAPCGWMPGQPIGGA